MTYLNYALFSKKTGNFSLSQLLLFQPIGTLSILIFLFLIYNPNRLIAQDVNPCETVRVTGTGENIVIDGVDSPIKIIKVYNSNWEKIGECSKDCGFPFSFATSIGDYFVQVQFYDENWGFICQTENISVTLTSPSNNCAYIDANGVCTGDFNLSTQAELDALCGCKIIEGNLFIGEDQGNTSDITSLQPLNELTQVNGRFFITQTQLINLNGLNSLQTVSEILAISYNDNLKEINGINKLQTVQNRLLIFENNALETVNGLKNIQKIGELVISFNDKLKNINVFQNITDLMYLSIKENPSLINLEGLNQLKNVGGSSIFPPHLEIVQNANLTNVDALRNIQSVENGLAVAENPTLNNACGIAHLIDNDDTNGVVTPSFNIDIRDNSIGLNSIAEVLASCQSTPPSCDQIALSQNPNNAGTIDISGLNTPHYIVKVYDADWNRLLSCTDDCAFVGAYPSGLYRIHAQLYTEDWQFICETDFLEIELGGNNCGDICNQDIDLTSQAEVDAFCGCEEINGILRIGVRSTPTDITSLENLKSIKNISSALEIYNTSLTDLNGLENLTFIGGAIIIEENNALQTLNGLDMLESVTSLFQVRLNDVLKSLDGLNSLTNVVSIVLVGNAELKDIRALEKIKKLGSLEIIDNDQLPTLEGLNRLETIGREEAGNIPSSIIIGGNASLTTLDALTNLQNVESDINIQFNNSLASCCAITLLLDNDPNNGGANGNLFINDNLVGCNSVQEILENCQNNTGDCADVKVEIAASEIPVPGIAFYNITGLTAPIEIVKVFNRRTYEKVFECNNNCGNSAFLELQEGAYVAQIQMYTANWGWICGRDIEFDVTTTDSPNLIDCDAITASYQFGLQDTYEGLGVEGLTAPIDIVKIYDANWNRVFECFGDCNNPTVVTDLAPNLYRVHAQQYDENWEQICETDFLEVTIPVSDGSLDRNSKNNIEFILFPNPVRNTLTINTSTLKGKKGSIQIYNILGHKITQMPNKFFDQAFETINLEHLENGLYYLNIQSNDFRAIGKQFIVEHLK